MEKTFSRTRKEDRFYRKQMHKAYYGQKMLILNCSTLPLSGGRTIINIGLINGFGRGIENSINVRSSSNVFYLGDCCSRNNCKSCIFNSIKKSVFLVIT